MTQDLIENNNSEFPSDEEHNNKSDAHMSHSDILYNSIVLLGLKVKSIVFICFSFIASPFIKTYKIIKFIFEYFSEFLKKTNKNVINEGKDFFNDIKVSGMLLRQNKIADKHQKQNEITLILRFFKTAINKHKSFLKISLSYILPLTMIFCLFFVVNAYMNKNFALEVIYNNTHIGYIKNENVFRHAKEILKQRLEISGGEYDEDVILNPDYKISVVDLSELSDANDICEQLILNSDSGLTTACGIYVDNKFIGSVKNESDASSVFKSYISAYCKSNGIDQNNSQFILDIVEKVSYIQGLYAESSLMDPDDLREYLLTNNKSEISKYTVKSEETVESICLNNRLTVEQFYAINPELNKNKKIKKNTTVNIIKSIPFINVTVSKTKTSKKQINYKRIEIETNSLYKGVEKIITPGVKGEKEVVTLVTYIDNVQVSTQEISSTVLKEAIDEKVYVGTKPVPNNVTILGNKTGAFVWPTVGADTVSSGFGYRYIFGSTSFHKGIDITGAGANGKPIIASASGVVERVTSSSTGYGYCVLIDHGNGIKTRYAHCLANSICVKPGQSVVQGQMIAKIGNTGTSTGPHLHFEIIYNGSVVNPIKYLTR